MTSQRIFLSMTVCVASWNRSYRITVSFIDRIIQLFSSRTMNSGGSFGCGWNPFWRHCAMYSRPYPGVRQKKPVLKLYLLMSIYVEKIQWILNVRIIFWCTDNGQRFRHHYLIRAMSVQIDRWQECSLTWMRLETRYNNNITLNKFYRSVFRSGRPVELTWIHPRVIKFCWSWISNMSSSFIVVQLSDVPDCLGTITCVTISRLYERRPAKIPHVSTLFTVFLWAKAKNFDIVSSGTTIWRRKPSSNEVGSESGFRLRSKAGLLENANTLKNNIPANILYSRLTSPVLGLADSYPRQPWEFSVQLLSVVVTVHHLDS